MTASPAFPPAPERRTAGGGGCVRIRQRRWCCPLRPQKIRRAPCLPPSPSLLFTHFRLALFTNKEGIARRGKRRPSSPPLPAQQHGRQEEPDQGVYILSLSRRPKRQPKPSSDEGYWDCSVCTFRNGAEAFKCMMCDVRKGTSTRKPRPVAQLVAQQVTQQFVPPTQVKKEKKEKEKEKDKVEKVDKEKVEKEKVEKEKSEQDIPINTNSHNKSRPRLKNVDRSSAQHLEVTVGDLTVIITDFKEKTKSTPASSATSADQHSQSGSSSDNTERGMSRSSSPRGEGSSINGESH
ncbi:YY1-associated factor 2 isoform X2 [Ambystoma mexicanum]|uniref:YY1-associated factor 2 isoform X2 n=1 Tax=Ambystoma mexicanum TaxID=8296 RepID=UPI0037E7920C